ncbi:hypothetical protein MMC29_004863 [Sticta canariensis]|nr:hypothetical protein [Sticta canariensis]
METLRKVFHYLANLEWTERKQHACIFCDRERLQNVVYESEDIIAFDSHKSAGRAHWLITPKQRPAGRHIRDIEALTSDDLPLRAANTLQSKKWLKSKSSF